MTTTQYGVRTSVALWTHRGMCRDEACSVVRRERARGIKATVVKITRYDVEETAARMAVIKACRGWLEIGTCLFCMSLDAVHESGCPLGKLLKVETRKAKNART